MSGDAVRDEWEKHARETNAPGPWSLNEFVKPWPGTQQKER